MFQNLVEKFLPKNARMVLYQPGHRGMACIRILASHKEVFYDKFLCYRATEDPLGFSNSIDNSYDNNNYDSYDKVDLILVWGDGDGSTDGKLAVIDQYQYILKAAKMAKEKLFFIASHDSIAYNIPYVHVYSSDPDWVKERINQELKYNTHWTTHFATPKLDKRHFTNLNCFCIDAFKLLSLDNQLFEEEYDRILDYFKFESNRDQVRQFVLTYRNREKQLREWQRTNSFPTPSQL